MITLCLRPKQRLPHRSQTAIAQASQPAPLQLPSARMPYLHVFQGPAVSCSRVNQRLAISLLHRRILGHHQPLALQDLHSGCFALDAAGSSNGVLPLLQERQPLPVSGLQFSASDENTRLFIFEPQPQLLLGPLLRGQHARDQRFVLEVVHVIAVGQLGVRILDRLHLLQGS